MFLSQQNNTKGFSLVSTMVAVGIFGILAAGMASYISDSFKFQSLIQDRIEAGQNQQLANIYLASAESCLETFAIQNPAFQAPLEGESSVSRALTDIYVMARGAAHSMMSLGQDVTPKMVLEDLLLESTLLTSDDGTSEEHIGNLVILYERKGGMLNNKRIVRKVPIYFAVNKANRRITSCSSNPAALNPSGGAGGKLSPHALSCDDLGVPQQTHPGGFAYSGAGDNAIRKQNRYLARTALCDQLSFPVANDYTCASHIPSGSHTPDPNLVSPEQLCVDLESYLIGMTSKDDCLNLPVFPNGSSLPNTSASLNNSLGLGITVSSVYTCVAGKWVKTIGHAASYGEKYN